MTKLERRLPHFCIILITLLGCTEKRPAVEETISTTLVRSTPEAEGISSSAISNLLVEIEKSGIDFHSIMIVKNDKVVAEGWWNPYKPEYPHTLYSLSKMFTSTAIGFAVDEGILSLEDQVVSFFPDSLPEEQDDRLDSMKIKHLLTMASGHSKQTMPAMFSEENGNWPKAFLAQPLTYAPGEKFFYNTGATYMLSAILQKKTGKKLIDFLTPRLFEPLGIEGSDWEEDPKGVNVAGYGLRVKTEDIAKVGLLYLRGGMYDGKRLLSEEWVKSATSSQIESAMGDNLDNDWAQGYGYKFWICRPEKLYRGDGAFGQYCIVMPDQNAIVAITSESFDMQASMNLIWDYLLPVMRGEVLPSDPDALAELRQQLENLKLDRDTYNETSTLVSTINGKKIVLEPNKLDLKSITVNFNADGGTLLMESDNGQSVLDLGLNRWEFNSRDINIPGRFAVPSAVEASIGWESDSTLIIDRRFVETAHGDKIAISIGDNIKVSITRSGSILAPEWQGNVMELTGSLE